MARLSNERVRAHRPPYVPEEEDELHRLTAEDAAPPRWRPFFRAFAEIALVFCLILPLWLGAVVAMRTVDNWMDGRGFTPVTHPQGIAPASWTPASVTWVQPAEVAQP